MPAIRVSRLLASSALASLALGGCSTTAHGPQLPPASFVAMQEGPGEEYVIGPLDELTVFVWRNPELGAKVQDYGPKTISDGLSMDTAGNVYVGDADSYFLNMGVHMLDNFTKKTTAPAWTGETIFQPMAPHCWGPPMQELMRRSRGRCAQ